ncbi:MAG: ASKHA domain-containing protein [Bacilli bacterium]
MSKLLIKQGNHQNFIVDYREDNLLEVLRAYGYVLSANCGGRGQCKKCLVEVNGIKQLACETQINDGMIIELPDLEETTREDFTPVNHHPYDVAFDIGTTTLAGYLIDGITSQIVSQKSCLNPQISFGADVISRIKQCQDGHLVLLHQAIIQAINHLIFKFLDDQIPQKIIISGNTTMLHLLLGVDPSTMGKYPYQPCFLDSKHFDGEKYHLQTKEVVVLPSISSFIGADIVAGILAVQLLDRPDLTLFLDLGTNGEMVLKASGKLLATSTAAGPAFEGTNIEKGMGGIKGAISQVAYDQEIKVKTIAGFPEGICGSGLIDIIAILIKEGLIDESGKFVDKNTSPLSSRLKQTRFYITDEIYISQKDVREFQLAKSAIISGMQVLLDQVAKSFLDVVKVYVAGGFGFHMNIQSALICGLFPKQLAGKIIPVGNTGGLGSVLVATNPTLLDECNYIVNHVQVIDLNKEKAFNDYFINNISFYNDEGDSK